MSENHVNIGQAFLQHTLQQGENRDYPEHWHCHGLNFVHLGPGILQITPKATEVEIDLVLSCGIHGNETAPIELLDRLIAGISRGELSLSVNLLIIFGNIPAMQQGVRFITENLNRLFRPGHALSGENSEQCRATELMDVIARFFSNSAPNNQRIHLDLHTAIRGSEHEKFAVHPYLHGKPYQRRFVSLLSSLGCSAILLSHQPTGTFSYFSSRQFGAESATVELGKARPFGQNCRTDFSAAEQTLMDLLAGDFTPSASEPDIDYFRVSRAIIKHSDDFRLCFSNKINNFTRFSKGELLCQEGSVHHLAEHEGEAIAFPNQDVAVGQRALLTLKQIDDVHELSWA